MSERKLTTDETNDILKVVTDYTYALDVLDKYDHQVLEIEDTTTEEFFQITYDEAMKAIQGLREKFGGSVLFHWLPFIKHSMDNFYTPA